MAKSEQAPAPAAKAEQAVAPVIGKAVSQADLPPLVEKWNPNPDFDPAETVVMAPAPGAAVDDPAEVVPEVKPKAKAKPAPVAVEPAEAADEGEATDEPAPVAAAAPKVDRRQQIKDAIAKQKDRLTLETAASAERKRADDAVAEVDRLKKASFSELLKFRGLDRQQVEDMLLIGADEVTDAAPAAAAPAPAAKDPELAGLLKWKADREAAEAQQNVTAALTATRDALKEADVPVLKVTRDGYARVMRTAHDAWMASGKSGSAWDYMADAAAIVEDEIRAENPDLAALVDKSKGAPVAVATEEGEEPAAPAPEPPVKAARVPVGRVVGAAPSAKPAKLPRDRDAKDREIKRRMGWDV